jgi:hypothetical protein
MDIVAHSLWATAIGKTWNRRARTRLRFLWFVFWTMFPDLFAFTPMVVAGIWAKLSGVTQMTYVHSIGGIGLYDLSHSFVVFAAAFAVASVVLRRPVWAMLGWALHIAIDIPTHSRYTTPFLWPLSRYRFVGIGWWEHWFMVVNYTALAIVFLLMWRRDRRERMEAENQQTGMVQK